MQEQDYTKTNMPTAKQKMFIIAYLLKRADLPTLGRPTIIIVGSISIGSFVKSIDCPFKDLFLSFFPALTFMKTAFKFADSEELPSTWMDEAVVQYLLVENKEKRHICLSLIPRDDLALMWIRASRLTVRTSLSHID